MGRLTEANYLSRRVKLGEQLAAAKDAHQEAAFRHEIEEVSADAVATARAAVAELDDRIVGLD